MRRSDDHEGRRSGNCKLPQIRGTRKQTRIPIIFGGQHRRCDCTRCGKIADFYDDEVDAAVTALTSILEPIMIVVMGIVIGGIVVAMYLPMFDMINAVQ